jgi:hypothetical protein
MRDRAERLAPPIPLIMLCLIAPPVAASRWPPAQLRILFLERRYELLFILGLL